MTIGYPVGGMELLVVDDQLRPLPDTVPGQLAIAGPGLARGYHADPELTEQKFVRHPNQPNQRLYLTGDLGRRWPDGRFDFMGRTDHQVKLRGYRLELGEIESILQSHPGVDRAAVLLVDGGDSPAAHLIAYVSPAAGQTIQLDELRPFLSARCPTTSCPRRWCRWIACR